MIDDLKLKKFLVVHSDGTRDIVKAVNDEFLEIRYEEIDEKIESIEEIKIQKIKIVKYGSILYEIKREYNNRKYIPVEWAGTVAEGNPIWSAACAGNVCGKPDTDPDHLRGMWYCR